MQKIFILNKIENSLNEHRCAILPPMDVFDTFRLVNLLELKFCVAMLDPWYNKGIGGAYENYDNFLCELLKCGSQLAQHVYLWGFPELIARIINEIPPPLKFVCWLTWYYKNNPSVIRGWRSAQQACLHLSMQGAKLYPEHFLNEKQLRLKQGGKLRYMPGPPSVIEAALNIGFIRKKEQTGHPSQKPMSVYETLLKMVTKPGDIVFDPMAGSGTTGALCSKLGHSVILCDKSEEYTRIMEKRLGVKRLRIKSHIDKFLRDNHKSGSHSLPE